METEAVPITWSPAGDDTAFAKLVEDLPGGRLIGDRWRTDQMLILIVALDEDAQWGLPDSFKNGFAHAHQDFATYPSAEYTTTVLWAPAIAFEMLCSSLFNQDYTAVSGHDLTPQYAAHRAGLLALTPEERCRRVLATQDRLRLTATPAENVVAIADAVSSSLIEGGLSFDLALQFVDNPDTFNPDVFRDVLATVTQ